MGVPLPELPPPVERLRKAWTLQAGGAREQALFALLIALVVGGAHVARMGTSPARLAAAAGVLLVVLGYGVLLALRRREAASARLTVQRVLAATDPALGTRALRALALMERTGRDDTAGSNELAELHFSRLVGKVSNDAVRSAAVRYGQRFRALSVALLCAAVVAVVIAPAKVVEGLDVLVARKGRAPLTMTWLGYPRVSAFPPTYTRESERSLVFGTSVALPKGTVITVRGVPLTPDRELVVTDGTRAEPFVPDGAGGVVSRYVVRGPASIKVAARFGDVRIEEDDALDMEVVPDDPPTIELEGAPRTENLAEMDRIDIRWTARDDHGLRQVDLVMRSGVREERRVLARFDGETKVERGGQVVTGRDAFLRSMFLPISVTVEAKDNDPLDGPKWAKSPAIVVMPPEVGQPEAERFAALLGLRDALVDLLKWRIAAREEPREARAKEAKARVDALDAQAAAVLAKSYSGLPVSRGLESFVRAQLDRLHEKKVEPEEGTIEEVLLAVDVTVGAAGSRDAVAVAKRLADVAEEAALGARVAREPERGQGGLERLDGALVAVERGVRHLATLGALGKDVGSVGIADSARVRRSRDARDYYHAELAALHLAARLRRPSPSFGSSSGNQRGGAGVESGSGKGNAGGDLPPPSSADSDFDRAANAVSDLAQQHESTMRGVESAMKEANVAEPSEADQREAKRLADKVRGAVGPLPLPGQEFGSPRAGAALAREHGLAAAHALDDFNLENARDSADNAVSSLDQAAQRLDANDPAREDLDAARKALVEASEWARRALEKKRAEAEARAENALRQAGDTERDLAQRADELGEGKGSGEAPLPRESAERLRRAASVMREAARELAEGKGEQGLSLQREAQRLLEQASPGRASDGEHEEEGERKAHDRSQRRSEGRKAGEDGDDVAQGGDVPGPDDKAKAEDFRRRVLEGLGKEKSERLSPAVRRYAEGLLR